MNRRGRLKFFREIRYFGIIRRNSSNSTQEDQSDKYDCTCNRAAMAFESFPDVLREVSCLRDGFDGGEGSHIKCIALSGASRKVSGDEAQVLFKVALRLRANEHDTQLS